jgi:hypothetical protein
MNRRWVTRSGRGLVALGFVASIGWLAWRVGYSYDGSALWTPFLLVEFFGLVTTLATAVWVWEAGTAQQHAAPRGAVPSGAEASLGIVDPGIVLFEAARRAVYLVVVALSLFSGWSLFDRPPAVAVGAWAVGFTLTPLGLWAMSHGHLVPGLRSRWSVAAIGEAARRVARTSNPAASGWSSVMATVVGMNLMIGLRGISDRWTHGLHSMAAVDCALAMGLGIWVVLVGLDCLRHMAPPQLGHFGPARRLDEQSARQMALGASALAGILGLVAGALPAPTIDAAVRVTLERERPVQAQVTSIDDEPLPADVVDALVVGAQGAAQRADQP